MYTIQALWTMVNKGLGVTVIVFGNRSYAILNVELERVGADEGFNKALENAFKEPAPLTEAIDLKTTSSA